MKHIPEKGKKANSILGAMRSFEHMDQDTFKKLFTALVRPHVEYANAVWSPSKKKDIDAVENVQRRATKMVPVLNKESYGERLKKLKLLTLSYRRIRGDMIQVFKLVNNMYDYDSRNILTFRDNSITRGNEKKVIQTETKNRFQEIFFY